MWSSLSFLKELAILPYSPLDAAVHARFWAAFGEPHASLGGGEEWSIKPFEGVPHIHLLVNGTHDGPSVWVFDPSALVAADGVAQTLIKDVRQADTIIEHIQTRLTWARQQRELRNNPK